MAGDIESAVGDFTRLSHLVPASARLLLRVAQLNYFLLPQASQAMNALKQCLHHDPDDKPCRTAHRLFKSLTKDFDKLEKAERSSDWKGVLRVVVGYKETPGLVKKFEEELDKAVPNMQLPSNIDTKKTSHSRRVLYKAACRAYGKDNQPKKGTEWCTEVLKMDENDADALLNRGDVALANEEWEEAVRAYDKAFEASGRSSQEVRFDLSLHFAVAQLCVRFTKNFKRLSVCSNNPKLKTITKSSASLVMRTRPPSRKRIGERPKMRIQTRAALKPKWLPSTRHTKYSLIPNSVLASTMETIQMTPSQPEADLVAILSAAVIHSSMASNRADSRVDSLAVEEEDSNSSSTDSKVLAADAVACTLSLLRSHLNSASIHPICMPPHPPLNPFCFHTYHCCRKILVSLSFVWISYKYMARRTCFRFLLCVCANFPTAIPQCRTLPNPGVRTGSSMIRRTTELPEVLSKSSI